ncbi:LAMI_0G03422g1_1 [Lachancea mirantina]|uniref:LAMI_0G03422g1_1 n=1 Tax=Lachancea mirantina TaxID=1230905 RepID=A0A1G4K844_9SACH|nr:LAMI_0G03422g1_1 [Lachancea mirantina]
MGVFGWTNRLVTLLFLAGTTLLLILIVLSGAIESYPIDRYYWVQGDTSGISGAPAVSRWTFWGVCNIDSNGNTHCDSLAPADPISPVDNFGTTVNVPSDFVTNRNTFYYLTRFSFCFFWIALAFLGIAFLLYILSWCSYAFNKVVFLLVAVGALFDLAAVSLQTAAAVMARNAFHSAKLSSNVSATLFGIGWASVACSIYLFFSTGASFIKRAYQSHKEYVEMQKYKEQALMYQGKQEAINNGDIAESYHINDDLEQNRASAAPVPDVHPPESHQSGIKFFKIRRSQQPGDQESV